MPHICVIFPDAVYRKNLVSLNRAVSDLRSLPETEQQAFINKYLPKVQSHTDIRVRVAVQNEVATGDRGKPIQMAFLGAAGAGEIKVQIKSGPQNYCCEIDSRFWRDEMPDYVDPVKLMQTGKVLVYRDLLPDASIECKLAGADLYISAHEIKRLARRNPASRAVVMRSGRKIVDHVIRERPDKIPICAEIMELLRQACPDASQRELERVWSEVAPADWKKPGRRSGRGSN